MKEALKVAGTAILNLSAVNYYLKKHGAFHEAQSSEAKTYSDAKSTALEKLPTETEKKIPSRSISSLAGLLSGTLAASVMYPTEALKKIYQTTGKVDLGLRAKDIHTWIPAGKKLYTGGLGFASSVGPATFIQKNALTFLSSNPFFANNPVLTAMISGGAGAVCSAIVENTILTQQTLLRKNLPANLIDAFKQLYSYGTFKMWTGFTPLVVRESVFGGLALSLSDRFALRCQQSWDHPYASTLGKLTIGICGALVTHPFDTLATRKQQNMHAGIQESLAQTVKKIYKNEGIKGFYKGGGWRVGLFTGCMLIISTSKKPAEEMLSNIAEQASTLRQ